MKNPGPWIKHTDVNIPKNLIGQSGEVTLCSYCGSFENFNWGDKAGAIIQQYRAEADNLTVYPDSEG